MLQSLDAPTKTISRDVMSAAALLDDIRPGWARQINPDKLHLSSCIDCVLGQVFGSYSFGRSRLYSFGRSRLPEWLTFSAGVFADNARYNADWIAAIAARVAA